jgi:hypothetical protein
VPHNRTGRRISAADGQALQTAQQIMNEVRSAYQQEPNAMLIADGTLNPLELIVVDGQTGRYYRIPVTCNDDGTFDFGSPIPVTGPSSPGTVNPQTGGTPAQASRAVSARDRQLIQAAVDRGAIPSQRAAFYAAEAAAGRDISQLAQLEGNLLPAGGAVAASAAPRDADAEYPEYSKLFGTVQAGQQVADDREIAARAAVAGLTDDQVYERLYGKAGAPAAPVAAATAGPASQHGQGGAARKRWREYRRVELGGREVGLKRRVSGGGGAILRGVGGGHAREPVQALGAERGRPRYADRGQEPPGQDRGAGQGVRAAPRITHDREPVDAQRVGDAGDVTRR